MSTPAAPTLNLTAASDTGLSHTDDITRDVTPVVVGTATPGGIVDLTDTASELNVTTRADKNGNFQFDLPALADGLHTLSAFVEDAAGNFSNPTTLNVDVESSATATDTVVAAPQTATSVTFNVHFDQPVSTISPQSFVLATTGTVFGNVTSVTGSGQDYAVTATGLGGEGTVALALSAYTPTDVAGNQVALISSQSASVADTDTHTVTLVSADQFNAGEGAGDFPDISGGGRLVAFLSDDASLVPGIATTAGVDNVYVKDVVTGTIALVTNGNDGALDVQISNDGTVVAFSSLATNLVSGGTPAGELNLYVATLSSVTSPGGLEFVSGSIRLVGVLDSDVAAGVLDHGFALSGDGSTVAYGSDAELPDGLFDDNSYTYDIATGAATLIPGANSGEVTSISNHGTVVGFNEAEVVPGTGGEPDPYFGGTYGPDYVDDALVYNTVTKSTTVIDGSGLLPDTTPPTAGGALAGYLTTDPQVSGNGQSVIVELTRAGFESALYRVDLSDPDVFTPISPGAATSATPDASVDYDQDPSTSFGAGVTVYTNDDPTSASVVGDTYSTTGHTTTSLGPGVAWVISAQGNAAAFVDYTDDTDTTSGVYEDNFGVSVGIAPIDGNDTFDKTALAQAVASGFTVSGTSNAPAGSGVQLFVTPAYAGGVSQPFTTGVGADGQWTATLPEEIAAGLPDGAYFLVAQVAAPTGASAQVRRLFTVDTVAPGKPTAPVLDQQSNTGKDGVDTNQTTPTLDGQTEAFAFVELFDLAGGGQTLLGTATADENGIYTVTASALADGTHVLAVQASDTAGNLSPYSGTTTIKVDTVAPVKPSIGLAPGQDDAALVEDTVAISRPVLTGSTEPNDTVTIYDGNTPVATGKADGNGTYTITSPTLANGDHSLVAVATDPAGNVGSPSSPLDLTVDTVAPGAPLLGNVNGATLGDGGLSPDFTVTGTAAAQTTVTLEVDGVAVAADSADTRASGAYTIDATDLSPGTHTLTVTATDGAGNVSQPSTSTTVTISSQPVGTPGPSAINGTLLDGPIAGATVFADANGNGVLDTGESSVKTTLTGGFSLASATGELVAKGGVDTQTGLAIPGPLTAPAGSTVIDPLTTLLDAYATATGQTAQAAQPALLTLLGLDPTADLTTLNPETVAGTGDPSFLIASAKVMDTAVVFADLAAAQTGASSATTFAAAFTALGQQAATGTFTLRDAGMTLANMASATAAIADPGFVLPAALAQDAAIILDSGNYDIGTATGQTPAAALTLVNAVEQVDQGQAAPGLAADSNDPASASTDTYLYSGGLPNAVAAAENEVLAAPVLAPASDTGLSAHDNATADTTVTFTGEAAPGATVILVSRDNATGTTIVGTGEANAGGAYAIAATLAAGVNYVTAFGATPGEVTAAGTATTLPDGLVGTQVDEVVVGDLPEDTRGALPQIEGVQYSASSANTAAATSLYITGAGTYEVRTGAVFTVTGNGVPVSQDAASSDFSGYGILTTPLVAGTYSLVVTETALDGETSQTNPVTVTVTAPGSRSIKAEEAGPIVGGPISAANHGNGNLDIYPQSEHPNATTDASGTAAVPLQGNLSDNGGTLLYPTDAEGLEVSGGEDSVTGQTIPLNLFAPPGATVIDPATSLLEQADTDATAPLTSPDAVDYAFEDRRIDTALGLPTTLDLDTADPLAMAATGNDTLLLKEIELQDTAFLLTPFTVDGVDDLSSADPLYVIDKSLSIYPFEAIINDKPPAITTKPIDFTSTAEVLSWMTTYDTTPIFGSYDTVFDASVLPVAAAIIAASNAAVEAHTAAATSQADALSYALAVEKTAFSGEQQAFQALANPDYFDNLAQQQAGFAALQTEYTGAGLAALVATTLAQNVQVTGFTTASTTAAAYTTFTITFSAPVGGITAGDFTLSESAGLSGVAITAVTPVAGSEGASYTVTASTGVGTGTLALGFNAGSITNAAGLPLDSGDFAAPAYYGSTTVDDGGSNNALGLALGDFTGDGRPDIVTANDSIDGLTLYVDGAGGSFTAEPAIYTGPSPAKQVVVGDFNGDGKLDALTLNANFPGAYDETVSALLGNGNGTFGTPIQTDIGPNVQEVLTGDFNGDGKLDLAVLGNAHYYTDGTVQLFDGKGDGTFTPGAVFDLGSPLNTDGFETKDMVEADLNGDGHPDLVIATATLNSFAANATVLLGDGRGGFTVGTPMALGLGSSPALIAVGDVNGDGIPDIVAVPQLTGGAETAEILLGHGDGTFGAATTVALPLPPGGSGNVINGNDYNTAVTIGDVTGDGHADIVVGNNETGIVVVPGKGDGTFGTGFVAQPGTGTFYGTLALADVNGDGLSDLVTTDSSGAYASSSVPPGISVAFNTPQTVLPAAASTAVTRAAQAQPTLMQSSGPGSLTHTGNSYTLNLGTVAQGSTVTAVLALLNAAAAPADSFDGTFTAAAGSGFAVSGARLSAALAAGQSGGGLSFTADTSTLGSQTETISFDPRDLTDDPAPVATLATDIADGETATTTEAPADAGGADVSFELDPIQIAVTDTVVSSGALAAPTITGTAAEQAGTDEAAIKPFAAVTIGDGNAGQVDTVVVTPSAAANGTLSDPAAASDDSNLGANGSITVSGSAAQVTAVLDGLVFTPTPHQAAPGSAVTTGFTLAVSDTAGQTASDSTTSTVVTAVLDAPVIAGTVAGQAVTGVQTVSPFATVTLTDPDLGASLVTVITLKAAGAATDADGTLAGSGLAHTGTGAYTMQAGSPAAEQALLRALVFTPAAASGTATTTFGLQVAEGTAVATDTVTTVTATQSTQGPPAVTLRLADDTGSSATDGITSDDTLAGTATAGDTITLSQGEGVLGQATVAASGTWSFKPTGLADGAYSLTATDTDAGGTAAATLAFTLDTIAPVVSSPSLLVSGNALATAVGITASDTVTASAGLTATITALPGDGTVTLGTAAIQQGQVLTGTQLAQLQFTPTAGTANASSSLGYTVTDAAGNAAAATATLGIGALTGGGSGDVHMVAFDGLHYDFQAIGDFWVARTVQPGADDGFAVQMRTTEWNGGPGTSIATEVAASLGADVVRFGVAGAPVTVNGAEVAGLGSSSDTVKLADGVLDQTGAGSWLLRWNTGESLSVTNEGTCLNFAVTEGSNDVPGTLQGLLGGGGPASDFALPDGTVLPQPLSPATILGAFADGWQVHAGQSLLATAIGASPPMAFLAPTSVTMADGPGAIWTGGLGRAEAVEIQASGKVLASGLLANLAAGDLIDLADLSGATGYAFADRGTIEVGDAAHAYALHVAGGTVAFGLSTSSDPHGGLLVHIGSRSTS